MRQEDKITEKSSLYHHLESKSVGELLEDINREDHKVADAVKEALPQIQLLARRGRRLRGGGIQPGAFRRIELRMVKTTSYSK